MKNMLLYIFACLLAFFATSIDSVFAIQVPTSKASKTKKLSSKTKPQPQATGKSEPDPTADVLRRTNLVLGEYELDHGSDTCQDGLLTLVKSDDDIVSLMLGHRMFLWSVNKETRQIQAPDCVTEIKNHIADRSVKSIVRQTCDGNVNDTVTEIKVRGHNVDYERKVTAGTTTSVEKCFLKRIVQK